jgi:hypothetical protein
MAILFESKRQARVLRSSIHPPAGAAAEKLIKYSKYKAFVCRARSEREKEKEEEDGRKKITFFLGLPSALIFSSLVSVAC